MHLKTTFTMTSMPSELINAKTAGRTNTIPLHFSYWQSPTAKYKKTESAQQGMNTIIAARTPSVKNAAKSIAVYNAAKNTLINIGISTRYLFLQKYAMRNTA